MMSARYKSILAVMLVTIVLAGCGTAPERVLSREPARYATLPNGTNPLNPGEARLADTEGAAMSV